LRNLKTPALLLAAFAALAAGIWTASRIERPQAIPLKSGILLQAPRPIADFTLTDQDGQPFTRAAFAGRWTLLFAGYTHCPDVCPTTLALMKTLEQQLAAEHRAPHVVFLSVDPERDAPARIKQYVRAFSPVFTGISGAPAQLDALCRSLGLAYSKVPDAKGAGYSMDHSAALTLINPRAEIAGYFQPPFQADALLADLRAVLPSQP
jgi:protein SCO1/2